jgi:hypothetical protein
LDGERGWCLMFGGRSFDVGPQGLDTAEDLVDGWLAKIEDRAARAATLTTRLGELSATAQSETGRVSVTVGATGVVTGLELDEAIREQPAADTAIEILATLQAALVSLATKAGVVTAETVGTDSETGRAVPGASGGPSSPTVIR